MTAGGGYDTRQPASRKQSVRRVRAAHPAAYARRVSAGDIDALADITILAVDIDDAIRRAVTGLRDTGYSWAEIGTRLGVTRQAAQQRWGGQP
jgi:hypothetical protein